MLTKSGAKLLDFGLAKAAPLETASPASAPLLSAAESCGLGSDNVTGIDVPSKRSRPALFRRS